MLDTGALVSKVNGNDDGNTQDNTQNSKKSLPTMAKQVSKYRY
jgi:hypothetical protein